MSHEFVVLLMRWMHIIAAIVAVGGSTFFRFVLLPVAGKILSHEDHERFNRSLLRRWKILVHLCILLFLVSGFYNYIVVAMPAHKGNHLYHIVMGAKILLAFVVFALAIGLTGKRGWSEAMRAKPRRWLSILLLFAYAVVLIAGVLRLEGTT